MKPINPINPIKPIKLILLSFLLLLSLSTAAKEKTYTLASPDGVNAHRKGSDYRCTKFKIQNSALKVHLAPGGGFVARIDVK